MNSTFVYKARAREQWQMRADMNEAMRNWLTEEEVLIRDVEWELDYRPDPAPCSQSDCVGHCDCASGHCVCFYCSECEAMVGEL